MIQENTASNFLVYELWEKDYTVDEIASETSIPRSTVGYYVRKFNKRARSGEPIVIPQKSAQLEEKDLAVKAYLKGFSLVGLLELIKRGELDKLYKILMIVKLAKELQRDIFPTEEEADAFFRNLSYLFGTSIDTHEVSAQKNATNLHEESKSEKSKRTWKDLMGNAYLGTNRIK